MSNQIGVNYKIIAQTKSGQSIHRVGYCSLSVMEESLHNAFTNIYFFVLAEFIKQDLSNDASQLDKLEEYLFLIDNIRIK